MNDSIKERQTNILRCPRLDFDLYLHPGASTQGSEAVVWKPTMIVPIIQIYTKQKKKKKKKKKRSV